MYMRTTELLRLIPLLSLLLFGLAACNDAEEMHLSPIQETVMEGDASTLQIDLPRTDWRIASVTDLDGYPPMGGSTELEGLGTVYYAWATIHRNKENTLTIETEDNFDGQERGFIIHIEMKTGFYRESITISQKPCQNFYHIESIEYSVEDGDGVKEGEIQSFKHTYKDETGDTGTKKKDFYPFINVPTAFEFLFDNHSDKVFSWIDPKECNMSLPDRIEDGKVIMGQQELKFCAWGRYYKEDELRYKTVEVEEVGHKWNIYSGIIYCKRLQVTFVVTLTRPGSDTKKVFKGKFTQNYPYDCSPVYHEVKDSLDDITVAR